MRPDFEKLGETAPLREWLLRAHANAQARPAVRQRTFAAQPKYDNWHQLRWTGMKIPALSANDISTE